MGRPYEDRGRNWRDMVTRRGMLASSHQNVGEAKNRFSLMVLQGVWPCLDFGLLAFRTLREWISVIQYVMATLGSCYSDQMSLVTLIFTELLETFSMLIGIVPKHRPWTSAL